MHIPVKYNTVQALFSLQLGTFSPVILWKIITKTCKGETKTACKCQIRGNLHNV